MPPKFQRELWRAVNDAGLPIRALPRTYRWGIDRSGQDVGRYPIPRFDERLEKRTRWTELLLQSKAFRERRERSRSGSSDPGDIITDSDIKEERLRRSAMAKLNSELYGVVPEGGFANDPEWDDVLPLPVEEPEGALATISYPAEYATGKFPSSPTRQHQLTPLPPPPAISYLRAVMANKEYSSRSLRLTETIIEMNPAHYTVWLFRASILLAMALPIPAELAWLNAVALEHLKNYQIWHHRHLLMDQHHPTIASDPSAVAAVAASERAFLAQILAHDTKNYHVWSYRSYLVSKLNLFADPAELAAVEALVDDDVRNNSAWSHRFFLVFSDPEASTPGAHATEYDAAVPQATVDREVAYAQEKIALAPQNQSPWNYLRGVLVKGGRKLGSVEGFVGGFVEGLEGKSGGKEEVRSTHALDLLAEIYAEKGDKERADLCLRRLGEKWDRIRAGYWEWRRKCLEL